MSLENEERKESGLDKVAVYQRDFRLTFGTPWGQNVLMHLAGFCCAVESTVNGSGPVDANHVLIREGRRQAFMFIQKALSLTPDEMVGLFAGRQTRRRLETGDEND